AGEGLGENRRFDPVNLEPERCHLFSLSLSAALLRRPHPTGRKRAFNWAKQGLNALCQQCQSTKAPVLNSAGGIFFEEAQESSEGADLPRLRAR
ncbi:MAG TPA: hypothetical protein VD997_17510, partial [Phycisphaerales bacterium]|nr:hypothetical protein [Phycisphaerales bacterium]